MNAYTTSAMLAAYNSRFAVAKNNQLKCYPGCTIELLSYVEPAYAVNPL
jgi:hypothetical protein